jgi:hypothetical protein
MWYDPTEYDKNAANELAFDNALEDIGTGDIHLVPDTFLFNQIQKRMNQGRRDYLSDIPIKDLNDRWNTNLFANV